MERKYNSYLSIRIYQPSFLLLIEKRDPQRPDDFFFHFMLLILLLVCFLEEHDRPHLYYPVTLWASIKKKGLLCLLGLAGMTNASRIVNHSKHSCAYMEARISQLTIQLPYVQYPRSTAMEIWQASVGCQMHFQGASSSSDLENKCAFK